MKGELALTTRRNGSTVSLYIIQLEREMYCQFSDIIQVFVRQFGHGHANCVHVKRSFSLYVVNFRLLDYIHLVSEYQ